MGNQHASGLLHITLYQRNTPPRTWLAGLTDHPNRTALGYTASTIDIHSPFGAGSEADVLVSELTLRPGDVQLGTVCTVVVGFTFAGVHAVQAEVQVAVVNKGQ